MTSKEAFQTLREFIRENEPNPAKRSTMTDLLDAAQVAANDERADAFAEGRFATLEKVV